MEHLIQQSHTPILLLKPHQLGNNDMSHGEHSYSNHHNLDCVYQHDIIIDCANIVPLGFDVAKYKCLTPFCILY